MKKSVKTCLNFGAGVNSTALIIELVRRKEIPDYVIFADTGEELPETYAHIERMRAWFREHGVSFIEVKSHYGKLYDYYFTRTCIPLRKFRDCTDKFKIVPMKKYASQFKKEGLTQLLGIAADEKHRIRESKIKWIKFRYPLVEWGWNRKKCIDVIKESGLPLPPKSGCYMCPFQPISSWTNLLEGHPELFKKAMLLEQNGRSYPKIALPWKGTLMLLKRAKTEQTKLTCFEEAMEQKLECPLKP